MLRSAGSNTTSRSQSATKLLRIQTHPKHIRYSGSSLSYPRAASFAPPQLPPGTGCSSSLYACQGCPAVFRYASGVCREIDAKIAAFKICPSRIWPRSRPRDVNFSGVHGLVDFAFHRITVHLNVGYFIDYIMVMTIRHPQLKFS